MTQLGHMTWEEARAAAAAGKTVILPVGSIEAHGPHLPLDVDAHQAGHVAARVAERVDVIVAPTLPFGYASTWMHYAGTISLSAETFQQVVCEAVGCLLQHGFRTVIVLNGHRPNGTAIDVAARRAVDALGGDTGAQVAALSYWEPGAAQVHALRRSAVGGMGHACELETSFQLATRPELVHMDRLEGVEAPLVGWDLVAPGEPARTYGAWPSPAEGHPGIFGDPSVASAESGGAFLDAVVAALVAFVGELESGRAGSYAQRSEHMETPA